MTRSRLSFLNNNARMQQKKPVHNDLVVLIYDTINFSIRGELLLYYIEIRNLYKQSQLPSDSFSVPRLNPKTMPAHWSLEWQPRHATIPLLNSANAP